MTKKLTVNTLAFGNLRTRKKQYTLMIIGIILAMIFTSGVPFFVSCMNSSQEEARFRQQGKQDYIIVNAQNYDFAPAMNQGTIDGEIGYAHILSYGWNEKEDFSDGTMIGWLDDRAEELYYPQIIEGRLPEKEGEIIFEKNALSRMKIEAKVGEKVTLKTLTCNGAEFLSEEKEKTYTLVGIMSDKKSNIENFSDESMKKAALLPAAFVAKNTQTNVGGKEALVAFLKENYIEVDNNLLWSTINSDDEISTSYIHAVSIGDAYSNIANNTTVSAFLSVLLAFLSCFGIVNAFNSNLKERKNQIGMLKAVGATRRQIINIFGREAFIICALTAPVSIGVSYVGVKLFAKLMGDGFIFKPDITVLLLGVLFGVICVMFSALIPLWSISKLSPMQAIRDIELMRKMKNKKIKSQNKFNVSRILAKRKLTFSKGRQVSVTLIITCSIVICCMAMSFLYTTISDTSSFYNADYKIQDHGGYSSSNSFINFKANGTDISENSIYEILELPQVKNVYGTKSINVNIVIEGEVPEYLQVNEYVSSSQMSSRFLTAQDVVYNDALSVSGQNISQPETPEVTKDSVKEYMQAAVNPDYTYTKQVAGFTDEELINATLTAESAGIFDIDEDEIIDGKINLEKLNSGEEIVIYAPQKIGFYHEAYNNGYSYGIHNLSEEAERDNLADELMTKNIKAEAESPFKAGDTIKISLLCDDGSGNVTREDREFKIGAIIGRRNSSGYFKMLTTVEGMNTFKTKFNYEYLDVSLKEECTAEIDEQMLSELSAMFPGKYIGSAFAFNEGEKQEFRTLVLSIGSLILVLLCVCISLINNSISAQIREGKRSIGTLRAVGASEKELALSYVLQIANMLLWGFGAGTLVYIVSYRAVGLVVTAEYWPVVLWPAFLVFGIIAISCYINLRAKIKTVTKHSIVENIRELG